MKRRDLLRHLQAHGCRLEREGGRHSLWINPANGAVEAVPATRKLASTFPAKSAASSRLPNPVARNCCLAAELVAGERDPWRQNE